MTWPKEQFRIVKVFEPDQAHPVIVAVRNEQEVRKLEQALEDFVRTESNGKLDVSLTEFLDERDFALPLTYSTFWPHEGILE